MRIVTQDENGIVYRFGKIVKHRRGQAYLDFDQVWAICVFRPQRFGHGSEKMLLGDINMAFSTIFLSNRSIF